MTERLRLDNESSYEAPAGALDAIVDAVNVGLHAVAHVWSDYVHKISESASLQGWRVVLLDTPDQAGALGYHDVGPDGKPYSRVFMDPLFDHGADWLHGALSVASVVSHETFEMCGDPAANLWANDSQGTLYARELSDACEASYWDVETATDIVSLSDFLYPDYFNPWAEGPFDHCGDILQPFGLAEGGYAIYEDGGQVGQVFAADYPAFKRETKTRGSRTFARGAGRVMQPERDA